MNFFLSQWTAIGRRFGAAIGLFTMCLWLLCSCNIARAETYYIAPEGKAENDGSHERPWPSVEIALGKVRGGNTIVFRPGIYRGPMHIAKKYAGTEKHPTILRSEEKWKAVVVGSPEACFSTEDNCNWLTLDGFEILGARNGGVRLFGDHDVIRNCWIHHNTGQGIGMGRIGGVIENNLVEFNGANVQFAHGIYISGDHYVIRGNIVRHNAGFGLHLYDSITNSVIENNLVYGQIGLSPTIVSCPDGGGHNRIVNNTFAGGGSALVIWNGDGEVVQNNILIATGDPMGFDKRTKHLVVDYNLCLPKSQHDGPHGITADPQFVAAGQGVYWLAAGSPAVGKGNPKYAPATDFWGRPASKDKAPDLGAFAFVPALVDPKARADWYFGWAYGYSPKRQPAEKANDMPDLWKLPTTELAPDIKVGGRKRGDESGGRKRGTKAGDESGGRKRGTKAGDESGGRKRDRSDIDKIGNIR